MRFDVGCSYYGDQSDIARTAIIGEANELQAQLFEALLAGLERECELARDGARALMRPVRTGTT
ncbi:M24 family metallopeptidase [Bradyrhizobium sp. 191]|nr:M24 family metallopeptidase [Bradyrhizobium sp. 191]